MFHKMAQMIQMHTEKKLLDEVFATYRDVQDAAAEMAQVLPCPRCGKQTMKIRPTTISDYYNEIAERMNLNHLDLICEALDCSPTEILVREPNPEPRVRNRTGFEKPVTGQRKDGE